MPVDACGVGDDTDVATEAGLRALLTGGRLGSTFRPVVRLHTGAVQGFMAALHPLGWPADRSVAALVRVAARFGLELELARAALRCAATRPPPGELFVGVPIGMLLAPGGAEEVAATFAVAGVSPTRVVVHLRLGEAPWDEVVAAAAECARHELRVAISGVSTTGPMIRLDAVAPSYVILDRAADDEQSMAALAGHVSSLRARCPGGLSEIVASGVETRSAAAALAEAGVDLAQGRFFGNVLQTCAPTSP